MACRWKFRSDVLFNQTERDLGPIGRGCKTWLFAGSDQGGDRLAKIYTVVGTCLRHDVDPRAYLTDVLPHLSTMPANRGRDIRALLPKAWKAAKAAEAAKRAAVAKARSRVPGVAPSLHAVVNP